MSVFDTKTWAVQPDTGRMFRVGSHFYRCMRRINNFIWAQEISA